MALGGLFADKGVDPGPLVLPHQEGVDALAARGQLVDDREVQVPVEDQGQGPGNGRGGHDQQMGVPALLRQGGPLGHAEAVLLVGHHQTEIGKARRLGNQGVGAHDQIRLMGGDGGPGVLLLGRGHGARQQGNPDPQRGQQGLQPLGVLLGQDLRGGHEGRLLPVPGGDPGRGGGHSGLAAAHVALDQPIHHPAALQIGGDLPDDPLLGPGQGEGQGRLEFRKRRHRESGPGLLVPPGAEQGEAHGEDEELLEDQPVPGRLQGLEGGGRVDFPVGRGRVAEAVLGPQLRGQQLRQLPQAGVQGLLDRAGDQIVVEPRGQGVDGHDPPGQDPGLLHGLEDGVVHGVAQIVPRQGPVEVVLPAVFQVVRHVALVEEGQVQPGCLVGHRELGQIQALADVMGPGGGGHEGPEAGWLVGLKLRDGDDPASVLVGPGEVGDQVVERADPEGGKGLRPGLPHALQIPHRVKQPRHRSRLLVFRLTLIFLYHTIRPPKLQGRRRLSRGISKKFEIPLDRRPAPGI